MNLKHGKCHSAAYSVWSSLQTRCGNPNYPKYHRYGARGITVSWESFEEFYADMGDKPDGTLLDRVDNNEGYSKANCRWADPHESAQNMSTSKIWGIHGHEFPSSAAASLALGLSRSKIRRMCTGRIQKGKAYPPEPGCYARPRYPTDVITDWSLVAKGDWLKSLTREEYKAYYTEHNEVKADE